MSLTGQVFGRWTVLEDYLPAPRGEKKWHCRCQCGTERYVLERSLKSGGSLSCGCARKEAAAQASSRDLTGMVFGQLTVVGKAAQQRKNGGVWWQCRCQCGGSCEHPATLLLTGKRTCCSGSAHTKNYAVADIAGRRFARLTAQYPTALRDEKGFVIWHCVCDCGNQLDVSYKNLMYGNQRSCGCRKKEHDRALQNYLVHVDGTSLDAIRSKKLPSDNTTGYKGVYLIRGRYVAKIVFQKKAYYLGTFSAIEDAVEARKEAEEAIFSTAVPFYEAWQKKAAEDPAWAEGNPVRVTVKKDSRERLYLEMEPDLQRA